MLKFFFICFCILFSYFSLVARSYRNPYKLIMIFGKKGSGKNTLLTKLSVRYNKLGYTVFSDSQIFNTYRLDTDWVGKYDFPENSVLLVQEAGITWDNRDFKSFSKEVRNFFKLQRHKKVIVYLCSQSFDVDKKLRDLTDEMYLLVNYMGIFSVGKKINKSIAIHNASENNDGESFLTETYSFDFPWTWKFTYIPRWVQFFDSFSAETFPNAPRGKWLFDNETELYRMQDYKYYKTRELLSYKDYAMKIYHNVRDTRFISSQQYKLISEE